MARPLTVGASIAAALALATPFIMSHEGLKLKASPDVGQTQSICYGHDGVSRGTTYTVTQCKNLLAQDEAKVTNSILSITPSLSTRTNQLAATIDFVYNVGVGAYMNSSVAKDFNKGNYKSGCSAMLLYVYAGGHWNQGLSTRRHNEYTLCMKGL